MSTLNSLKECYQEISNERDACVFIFSASIEWSSFHALRQVIESHQNPKRNIVVVITTSGGDTDVAFKIGNYLQEKFEEITFLVFGWCKSAGTLLCLSGQRLIMSGSGELGPLDIQLPPDDENKDWDSIMNIIQSLETLSGQAHKMFISCLSGIRSGAENTEIPLPLSKAEEISEHITARLLERITSQIDPFDFTRKYRYAKVTEAYASRLNLRLDYSLIQRLVAGYPTHEFPIMYKEAKQLFETRYQNIQLEPALKVDRPNKSEKQLEVILADYELTNGVRYGIVTSIDRIIEELLEVEAKEHDSEESDSES